MKILHALTLFLLTIASSLAQQVLIDPTSVTLTKPGMVTVIASGKIIGHNVSFDAYLNVTVGTIKASLYHAIYANEGTSVGSWLNASSASSGTLDTGTYPVGVEINMDGWDNPNPDPATYPRQITVILWNESANAQGPNLSDIELTYSSATSDDQAAFQTFIVSLVQQQLNNLQSQIDSQQDQIAAQQQSDSQHTSEIATLQQQLANLQSSYNQLASELPAVLSRLQSLETGTNVPTGGTEKNTDETFTYVGVGLGAAGVVGAIMNAIFDSKTDASPENH